MKYVNFLFTSSRRLSRLVQYLGVEDWCLEVRLLARTCKHYYETLLISFLIDHSIRELNLMFIAKKCQSFQSYSDRSLPHQLCFKIDRDIIVIFIENLPTYFLMLRAVPDWKFVQLVNSNLTNLGPKAIRGRSKFSTEATLAFLVMAIMLT